MRTAASLLFFLAALAQAQQQSPQPQGSWPCVDAEHIDPSYMVTAEATGGQVYMLDKSEVEDSAELIAWRTGHEQVIFRALGQLNGGNRVFSFPVDSQIDSMVVSAWVQCKDTIQVTPPAGGDGDYEAMDFLAGAMVRFKTPKPGTWQIQVSGRGLSSVVIEAKTRLALNSARFVRWGGRPGHEGWFPIDGQPKINTDQIMQVNLSQPASDLRYSLIGLGGEIIDTVTGEDGILRFPLRRSGFRVAVDGRDANGYPFRRVTPQTITAVSR